MYFQIGPVILGDDPDGPDPGVKNADWRKVNTVVVEKIPGKGKKDITIRTSDITLDECTLTVRSITNKQYVRLKLLCDLGGPYKVTCNHVGGLWMYIIDRQINHSENDKELPATETETDEKLNVATWTIQLQEAND
jgi:hypothetical protein